MITQHDTKTVISPTPLVSEDPKVLLGAVRLGEPEHMDMGFISEPKRVDGDCSIREHVPSVLWSDWPKNLL